VATPVINSALYEDIVPIEDRSIWIPTENLSSPSMFFEVAATIAPQARCFDVCMP
jgi:hypothetical protein